MLTDALPPKIGLSLSSARMLGLSLGSCSLCLRMYAQIFLVTSVRGRGWLPTTAASASSGCMGFMKPPALPPVFALLLGIDAPPLMGEKWTDLNPWPPGPPQTLCKSPALG